MPDLYFSDIFHFGVSYSSGRKISACKGTLHGSTSRKMSKQRSALQPGKENQHGERGASQPIKKLLMHIRHIRKAVYEDLIRKLVEKMCFLRISFLILGFVAVFQGIAYGQKYIEDEEPIAQEVVGELMYEKKDPASSGQGEMALPGQKINWRAPLYSRTVSAGLELAHRLEYSYRDPNGYDTSWSSKYGSEIDWFFGFNLRVFFGDNWGIGIEGLVMDYALVKGDSSYSYWDAGDYYGYLVVPGYETTIIKWLVDFDILYRLPLTPRFLLNAGIGLTVDATTWETKDGYDNKIASGTVAGDIGYNWKLGAEYFTNDLWSLTLDWKWQTWKSGVGQEKYSIFSIVMGVNVSI
jgi:hypothetical protein